MDMNAEAFVEIISDWVQSQPSILVADTRLDVDSTCPTELESFASLDCDTETSESGSDETEANLEIVIGAVCAAVIIVFIIVVIVIILVRRRKHTTAYGLVLISMEVTIGPAVCNG